MYQVTIYKQMLFEDDKFLSSATFSTKKAALKAFKFACTSSLNQCYSDVSINYTIKLIDLNSVAIQHIIIQSIFHS